MFCSHHKPIIVWERDRLFTVSAPPTNVSLNLESEKRADVEKQATQDAWVLSEQIHSELHHVRHQ